MKVIQNLQSHLRILAEEIGIRSILEPNALEKAALYIESQFETAGLHVVRQEYDTHWAPTANIVARTPEWEGDKPVLVIGAHYDTVIISPGADDNASSVAVMIETARKVALEASEKTANLLFVAFSTEEPPCYDTEVMGELGAGRELSYFSLNRLYIPIFKPGPFTDPDLSNPHTFSFLAPQPVLV